MRERACPDECFKSVSECSMQLQDERCEGCGFLFRMTLRVNVASLTCQQEYVEDFKKVVEKLFSLDEAADVHLEIVDIPATYTEDKKICEWKCNADRGDKWELTLPPGLRTKAAGEEVTLIVSVTEPDKVLSAAKDPKTWSNLWKDAMSVLPENGLKPVDTDVLEVYPLLGGKSVTLKQCYKKNSASKDAFFENCLRHKEARVAMMQLGRSYTCEKDCAKGVCQFKDASRYEDDQVEREENGASSHDRRDITYPHFLFESATRSVCPTLFLSVPCVCLTLFLSVLCAAICVRRARGASKRVFVVATGYVPCQAEGQDMLRRPSSSMVGPRYCCCTVVKSMQVKNRMSASSRTTSSRGGLMAHLSRGRE